MRHCRTWPDHPSFRPNRAGIFPRIFGTAFFDGAFVVGRKKGDLPGRFVNAYLRKNPHQPGEYVNVAEYQERVEANLSKLELADPQGKLDLEFDTNAKDSAAENAANNIR
jgi:hypothetical protein